MADIPKSIRIGGRQVKVSIVEDLEEYGNFTEDTLTIQLKKTDAETMRVTLRHELMHAALSISGIFVHRATPRRSHRAMLRQHFLSRMGKDFQAMKAKSKVILLLSDLHIGSTVGLWPEGFVCNEGFPIGQNQFQKWLWKCWNDMLGWASTTIGKDDFELVLNGDLVEGIHHKSLQVMSADVSDQTTAVLDVLSALSTRAARLHVVKGTECHTRNDEIRIGAALGGTKDPVTGQHAWDRLDLDVNGCLVSFAHHIGTTSRPYLEAAQHSINLGVEIHEAARMGRPIPKVICRAHRHRHGIWSDGNSMSIVTGAWQGITRFGRKVVPAAVPQPSAIILDWRSVEKGELPIVHPRVYTAK